MPDLIPAEDGIFDRHPEKQGLPVGTVDICRGEPRVCLDWG
jgi:hypothetical protein